MSPDGRLRRRGRTACRSGRRQGVNALTPGSEGDYGVYQAFSHSFISSSFSETCVIGIAASYLKSLFGRSPYGLLGSFGAGTIDLLGGLTKGLADDTQVLLDRYLLMMTRGAALTGYRRERLPRASLPAPSEEVGKLVGRERHVAPDGDQIDLVMRAVGGRFEYQIRSRDESASGRWIADSTNRKRLAGMQISDRVTCTEANGESVVLSSNDCSLRLYRRSIRTVEAARVDEPLVVAQYYAFPTRQSPKTYVAFGHRITPCERQILITAMASGVVLLLRPLPHVVSTHWVFSWQRPVLTPDGCRRRGSRRDSPLR